MSIPVWARVGAKVVCVDDADSSGRYFFSTGFVWIKVVAKGNVYTITGHEPHPEWDGPCVQLAEIAVEHYLALRRFRPLISQADDLAAHFKALLSSPVKKEEVA